MVYPHSANLRMIEATCQRSGIPTERNLYSMEYYGNTSSASIPLALDTAVRTGIVSNNDLLLLYGFGGGLAYAGLLVSWQGSLY
ncbi:3-oxoacyl-[acyl-carrier-protein] synthase III C-terminal domain-containing protein [Bacillus sp. JCM 19041]|uniref:3-oxoacyl-[acyl-carrier-protein] synthase III C-terminal domain-containing protein n=1 Tax=Bacillus sp. JCM 19041 TaxID=1460637 RepID=UPI000AC4253A